MRLNVQLLSPIGMSDDNSALFALRDMLLFSQSALQKATTYEHTAVLVEPAKSRATAFCLRNLAETLETNWGILFYHAAGQEEWARAQIPPMVSQQVSLRPIPDNKPLHEFLASSEFLEAIPTEVFLLMRTDSMINPSMCSKLRNFIQYDYVGAPWPWEHLQVGNGHLSIRRKSAMLRILKVLGPIETDYEDQYVSHGCKVIGANVPSKEVAREFCVSELFHSAPFGFHRPWDHLPTRFEDLCLLCPGLRTLKMLQEVVE